MRGEPRPVVEACTAKSKSFTEFWRQFCRLVERLLPLALRILIGVVLVNGHVFGHHMGKDKAEAHEHDCDSYTTQKPALACRFLALSHGPLLSVLQLDNNSL